MRLALLIIIFGASQPKDPIKDAYFNLFESGQLVATVKADLATPKGEKKYALEKVSATLYTTSKKTDPVKRIPVNVLTKVFINANSGEYLDEKILKISGNCAIKIENGPAITSNEGMMDIKLFDVELLGSVKATSLKPDSKMEASSEYAKIFLRKREKLSDPAELERLVAHTNVAIKDPDGFNVEADRLEYENGIAVLTAAKHVLIIQKQDRIKCKTSVVRRGFIECFGEVTAQFGDSPVTADKLSLFTMEQNKQTIVKKLIMYNAVLQSGHSKIKGSVIIKEGDDTWVKGKKMISYSDSESTFKITCQGDMEITPSKINLYKNCEIVSQDFVINSNLVRIFTSDGKFTKFVAMENPVVISQDGTMISSSLSIFEKDTFANFGRPYVSVKGPDLVMKTNRTFYNAKSGKFIAQKVNQKTFIRVKAK